MKKTLALILAAMMVAGTASVAFANYPEVTIKDSNTYYVWDKKESRYDAPQHDYVVYGDKIALDLSGDGSEQDKKEVTKNKVFPDWKTGSDLVESAEIKYVKVNVPTVHKDRFTLKSEAVTTKKVKLTQNAGSATANDEVVVTVLADTFKDAGIYDVSNKGEAREFIEKALTAKAPTVENKTDGSRNVTFADITDATDREAVINAVLEAARKSATETTYKAEYKYMVVITLKDSTSTKVKDLSGDIRVAKTLTAAKNDAEDHDAKYVLDLEVKHNSEEAGNVHDSITVTCDKYNENHVLEIEDDADVTDIEFGTDGELALFTVNLDGQSDINVGYSTKFDADIAAKYPDANLDFIKWTASPVFNRTGDLYIYAEEDTFLYEVTPDGLKEVKKAEYDEDYGAHYLRTRKLGSYVVSDIELDLAASSENASSSGTSSSNPSTGGTTGTTTGNPGDKYNPNTGR